MFHLLHLLVGCMAIVMAESSFGVYNNDRPVIGVLSMLMKSGKEYYISAAYTKWIEAAGARSIVIPFDADDETVERIFTQINGVLIPGGSKISHVPNSVKKIFTMAKKINDDGDNFPVWGTCLGFEYLIKFFGEQELVLSKYDAQNISLPMTFTDEVQHSRLFADEEVKKMTSSQPLAFHHHSHGVKPELFRRNDTKLSSFFYLVSTSSDRAGREFVNAIEAKSYPFFGVQFHPEKTNFEYSTVRGTNYPIEDINHSDAAVLTMYQLARVFVNEARQNRGGHYTNVTQYPPIVAYKSVFGISVEQRYITAQPGKDTKSIPGQDTKCIPGKEAKCNPGKETKSVPLKKIMHMLWKSIGFVLLIVTSFVAGRKSTASKSSSEEKGLLMA